MKNVWWSLVVDWWYWYSKFVFCLYRKLGGDDLVNKGQEKSLKFSLGGLAHATLLLPFIRVPLCPWASKQPSCEKPLCPLDLIGSLRVCYLSFLLLTAEVFRKMRASGIRIFLPMPFSQGNHPVHTLSHCWPLQMLQAWKIEWLLCGLILARWKHGIGLVGLCSRMLVTVGLKG